MRVAISGPSKWKSIEKRNPVGASLAKEWISTQLDLAEMHSKGGLEAATSLQLGLDTFFASLCVSKGIPFRVFLACNDQDQFWDEETKEIFRSLCSKAKSVECVCSDTYRPGCISDQAKTITDWLADRSGRLLLIQNKRLAKAQVDRRTRLTGVAEILTFKM